MVIARATGARGMSSLGNAVPMCSVDSRPGAENEARAVRSHGKEDGAGNEPLGRFAQPPRGQRSGSRPNAGHSSPQWPGRISSRAKSPAMAGTRAMFAHSALEGHRSEILVRHAIPRLKQPPRANGNEPARRTASRLRGWRRRPVAPLSGPRAAQMTAARHQHVRREHQAFPLRPGRHRRQQPRDDEVVPRAGAKAGVGERDGAEAGRRQRHVGVAR